MEEGTAAEVAAQWLRVYLEQGRMNSGIQRGISPQLALTILNIRQQVTQKYPHPGRLLWVP